MPKIVVYYRSSRPQFYNATWVTRLQQWVIEGWSDAAKESNNEFDHWEILESFYENYKGRDGIKRSDLPNLDKAIKLCEKEGASLAYIELKMWRPNPFIDDKIDNFIRKNGEKRVIVIPTSGDDGAFEINEYFLKKAEEKRHLKRKKLRGRKISNGIRKAREANGATRDPKELVQTQSRGGKMKRARSLFYLGNLAEDIIDFEGKGLTNQEIANSLNKLEILTVSGKEWSSASVSKARKEIHTPGFQDRVFNAMKYISPEYDYQKYPMHFVQFLPK